MLWLSNKYRLLHGRASVRPFLYELVMLLLQFFSFIHIEFSLFSVVVSFYFYFQISLQVIEIKVNTLLSLAKT